jgi:ribosomal protein L29
MKKKEFHNLAEQELDKQLNELESELIKIRGQAATGTAPKNTLQIRRSKRLIARLLTIKQQKGFGAKNDGKPKKQSPMKQTIKKTIKKTENQK